MSALQYIAINSMQRVVPSKADSLLACLQTPVRSQLIITMTYDLTHTTIKNVNSGYEIFE
jgi:hypothetical protein